MLVVVAAAAAATVAVVAASLYICGSLVVRLCQWKTREIPFRISSSSAGVGVLSQFQLFPYFWVVLAV